MAQEVTNDMKFRHARCHFKLVGDGLAVEQNIYALVTSMMDALNQHLAFLNETSYREFSILDHQMMPPLHAPAQILLYENQEMRSLLGFFERIFDAEEQKAMMKQCPNQKVTVANQKSLNPVQVSGNLATFWLH